MKKIIRLLFIIIFTALLSGTVVNAIVEDLSEGTTSRGVPVEMHWSGGASWGDDKWFPDMKGSVAVYCAQHGGTFFKYVQPSVTIDVTLTGKGYSGASQTYTLPKSSTLNEQFDVWTGDVGHGPPTYGITMNATAYSGYSKGSITAACGEKTTTGTTSATIYTTGITKFSAGGGGGGPNTVMAYILAETSHNHGAPASSYVQYAFWAAQGGGGGGGSSSIPSDIFSGAGDLGEDAEDAADPSAFSDASSLYEEACDFKAMRNAMGDDYSRTVVSLIDMDKITVEFDGDNNMYTVGPFAIQYLERYTGTAQLAGMYGVPNLTVRKNGEDTTIDFVESTNGQISGGSGWTFYYKTARVSTGIPEEYQVYPHSGEKFYINLKYEEGIEQLKDMEFKFRYLEADGTYTQYTGNIEVVEWKAELETTSSECTDHSKCSKGSEHDSPKDHGSDGEEDKCSGGYHCTHSSDDYKSWTDHTKYTKVVCKVTAAPSGLVDIQDAAVCAYAWREYRDLSQKISLGIDLTTMIAGDVWVDIDPQKDSSHVNGIKDEAGISNIAVTVYLYNGTEKTQRAHTPNPRETALAHDEDGNLISWPIFTDSNGHWQVDRIEPPATEKKTECFYVAEFQYDGQTFRHTVFLANASGGETTVGAYNKTPNSYSNSSMAVEDQDERYNFDQQFGEITGDSQIDNDGNTIGQIFRTNDAGKEKGEEKSIKYTPGENEEGAENVVVSKLDSAATEARGNSPEKVIDTNFSSTQYTDSYRITAKTYYDNTPLHGNAPSPAAYRIEYPIKKDGKRKWTLNKKGQRYIDTYMIHINLGLQKRPYTDMSILKDVYKVTVVVNEQKLTKQFNYLKDIDPDYKAAFEGLYEKRTATDGSEKYALGLYGTDLSYQSYQRYHNAIEEIYKIKKDSEIRVYVSYVIRVYNNSATNAVELNELVDYYDPTYTLVQEENGFYNLDDNDKYMWETTLNVRWTRS